MKVDYSGMAENLKSDLKKAIEENKETLKPCPFCGCEAMLTNQLSSDEYGHKLWNVFCRDCGNSTASYWDKEIVVEKWNTRTPAEEVVARLEECAEDCKQYWDSFDDEDAFGGMNAYFNAIAIVKEGMG